MKKLNPVAKELRTPKYRQRSVKNKKSYDRKNMSKVWDEYAKTFIHQKYSDIFGNWSIYYGPKVECMTEVKNEKNNHPFIACLCNHFKCTKHFSS